MNDQGEHPTGSEASTNRRTLPIQLHLTLLACALTMLPVAIFGLNERDVWRATAEAEADAKLAAHAAQISDSIAVYLAGKQELLSAIAGGFGSATDWEPPRMQAMLDAQVAESAGFSGVYIADQRARSLVFAPPIRSDGTPMAAGIDYSDRDYVRRMFATGALAWGAPQQGRQLGKPNLLVAAPIRAPGDGTVRGAVGAGINLTVLQTLAAKARGVDETGRAVLRTESNAVVFDTRGVLPLLGTVPAQSLWAQACPGPAPTAPVAANGPDEDGVMQRALCTPIAIGEGRYTLVTTLPSSHIATEVDRATSRVGAAALVSGGLAIVVANLAAWVVARRARRVVRLAEAVGRGDYSYQPKSINWMRSREGQALREAVGLTLQRLQSTEEALRANVRGLKEANERIAPLAEAWEQVQDGLEIWAPDGQLLAANPAARALDAEPGLQADPDDASRRAPLADLRFPADGPSLLQRARSGEPWRGEVEREVDGVQRIEALSLTTVRDAEGAIRWIVVGRRDLTEQRRAESAAQQNARLAAIGTLAAGVAHEVNNPLTVIGGALEAWGAATPAAGTPELDAARIEASRALVQARTILRSLLELGGGTGGTTAAIVSVALREAVLDAAAQVERRRSAPLPLRVLVDEQLRVAARAAELVQVLVQLLDNAGEARASHGDHVPPIRVRAGMDGGMVAIEIIDDGPGMDPATLERAFDPFFSTRGTGRGAGLGLPLSRSLVQGMGGALQLQSAPGAGTTALLRLPAASTALPRARTHEAPTAPLTTRAPTTLRLLVVDDDPPVARSVARMLRGHDVHIALGGEDALRRLSSERFDGVLCDVMMPEIDGPTLYAYASQGWPELSSRFLFMTGAATTAQAGAALSASGRPVLQKPLEPSMLRAAVEALPVS